MNVLLIGCDGYIGNAITQRLLKEGHFVIGIDDFSRRSNVNYMNSKSATPIMSITEKSKLFNEIYDGTFDFLCFNINDNYEGLLGENIKKVNVILNLAHQPSGPFSMINQKKANNTLINNIIGTNNLLWYIKKYNPDCHYITIGTTGEYDHYSNIDIEEGYITINHKGRESKEMIYPRRPGSIYHSSKCASTYLIDYLTRAWNLKCTDVQQSVVFGIYTDEINEHKIYSRFDSDEAFGTVLNRFIVQAILGEPLTVYGKGDHQRGFLSLNDSVQALMIAVNNPAQTGYVQVWNQLSEWHSMNKLANMVKEVCNDYFSIPVEIQHIDTPRAEYTGKHYYRYITDKLKNLGYKPTRTVKEEIAYCIDILKNENLEDLRNVIIPKINFRR